MPFFATLSKILNNINLLILIKLMFTCNGCHSIICSVVCKMCHLFQLTKVTNIQQAILYNWINIEYGNFVDITGGYII